MENGSRLSGEVSGGFSVSAFCVVPQGDSAQRRGGESGPIHPLYPRRGIVTKLHLDIDDLRIDSFATDTPARERGTVAAHEITQGAQTCYDCTRFGCPQTDLCL